MKSYKKCINEHRLYKISALKENVIEEIVASDFNLFEARKYVEDNDYVNAVSHAYYAMFHAAKALALNKGLQEKNHDCLISALQELYVKNGDLKPKLLHNIDECLRMYQIADSQEYFDKVNTEVAISYAEEFSDATHTLLYNMLAG